MAKGEFENRDREESLLSDLPYPLARERGEAGQLKGDFGNVPLDIRNSEAARAAAANTGLGTPLIDYTVRSNFDSRPIGAYDFNVAASFSVDLNDPDPGTPDFRYGQAFAVPFGKIIVLRQIEFLDNTDETGTEIISSVGAADFLIQVCRNGGVQTPVPMPSNAGIASGSRYLSGIPVQCPQLVDLFLIFDQDDTFGLNFLPFIITAGEEPNFVGFVNVMLRGNYLVKTGIPPQFEVANRAGYAAASASTRQFDQSRALTPQQTRAASAPVRAPLPQAVAPSKASQPVRRTVSQRAQHFRDVEAGRKKDTFRRTR